jgi:hypothetical protein
LNDQPQKYELPSKFGDYFGSLLNNDYQFKACNWM